MGLSVLHHSLKATNVGEKVKYQKYPKQRQNEKFFIQHMPYSLDNCFVISTDKTRKNALCVNCIT